MDFQKPPTCQICGEELVLDDLLVFVCPPCRRIPSRCSCEVKPEAGQLIGGSPRRAASAR